MRAEALRGVAAVRREVVRHGLVLEPDGQLERRTVAGRAVVLHERADGAPHAADEGGLDLDVDAVVAGGAFVVPVAVGVPQLVDRRNARLGHVARLRGVPESRQGIECVEAFAHVVRAEVHQRTVHALAVERQRHGSAIGKECRPRVLIDRRFVDGKAQGLRRQQRVEVPSGDVGLGVHWAEGQARVGPHHGAKEGDVVVVRVEDARHRARARLDGGGDVGGVDVAQLHGRLANLPLDWAEYRRAHHVPRRSRHDRRASGSTGASAGNAAGARRHAARTAAGCCAR